MSREDSESDLKERQLVAEDDDISEGQDNQVNLDAESTFSDGRETTLEEISERRDQ